MSHLFKEALVESGGLGPYRDQRARGQIAKAEVYPIQALR
jgi:hypothetical protein